ncbi:MAG TPA: DNA mismatch repair endonuclease MutL [Bacilli bacterium]
MGRIHVLDEHIANQIAAGEVVERPSSVVKELVENSIDAGSTSIDVYLEEGGMQLIRIVDNGSGMDAEDSEIAFYRHATSKITAGKDLFQIRSLGFRGEALPSIAAVAKVSCLTSSSGDGLGRKIVIEGGTVQSFAEEASIRGTDIQVRDLFYNTPARLKYMKTIQTELGNASDYIYRLALAHPGIAFSLRHNDNVLLQTLGNGDVQQVIAAIYGISAAKSMLPVQGTSLDYSLSGFVSRPEITRANRTAISTFINGRYIRNPSLGYAIVNAYHTLLPIHRFPVAVLSIEMDASLVDVNVHPSKLEVRFSKEAELIQFITDEIKKVLNETVLIPVLPKPPSAKQPMIQEQLELYRTAPIGDKSKNSVQVNTTRQEWNKTLPVQRSNSEWGNKPETEARSQAGLSYEHMKQLIPQESNHNEAPSKRQFPKLHPIGQMHGTYIIAQNEDGLFLIDQHAAHERINYEYYYEVFGNPAQVSQDLLIPIHLEFTPSETESLKGKLILFEQAGVFLEYFGGNTFTVRSYPHWFPVSQEKEIIEEMAEWILSEKKSVDIAKLREKAAILCSCKASIKANDNQSLAEIESLLDRLMNSKNPYTCPHGRPIVVSFSTYELEKMFKRVM